MPTEEIIPLTKRRIPTILGFDVRSSTYTIGDEARLTGLHGKGQTAVFNFKPAFGAGDKEFSKDKEYWFQYQLKENTDFRDVRNAYIETFSAKEAAVRFLKTLLSGIQMPETIIVGEPGIREPAWRKNFRRNVREVFSELGLGQPDFFPEPFAVFQYYRHVAKILSVAEQSETILIIDIGGGTFNSCIIRTTESGLLARSGTMSIPLALQAGTCGGSQIDKELLKVVIHKSQRKGLLWKDDPIARVEKRKSPALLRIEDAKVRLSEAVTRSGLSRLADDFSKIETQVFLPKDELHPDFDITEILTGEDLKTVIREMWRRHYGHLVIDTVNEAKDRLASAMKISLDRIDKVLVAGGSSRLPFMKEEIQIVLPTLVNQRDIIIGSDIDEAVAYGIAWECREQVRRDPKLSVGKIAPCVLNDLYLGFRESRRDQLQIPRIKYNGTYLADAQLLSAPFETEASVFNYEVELPFEVSDKILYAFTDKPIQNDEEVDYLNLSHDVFSAPKLGKLSRKCELSLEIKPSGMIKPTFFFRGKGSSARKLGEKVACPEFYFPGFQIKRGNAYVGLDFGNSNSYLVRFASIPREITASEYPQFTISPKVKDRLRVLELTIRELRDRGVFSRERLVEHALDEALEIIFHSNKIEGSPLTRGETETILSQEDRSGLSEKQLEAKNLEAAYYWMLANFESCLEQPEAFIREINRLIVKDIQPNCGQYRTDQVSLSGMDFVPPQGASVPAFMEELGEEVKTRGPDRSPLEFATSLHTKLVWIHPFADGNGRTARLILDACLLAQGLPVVVVNYADRERYLHCLADSNKGDLSSMVEFFIECFGQQLEEFTTAGTTAAVAIEDFTDTIEEHKQPVGGLEPDQREGIEEIAPSAQAQSAISITDPENAIEEAIKEVGISEGTSARETGIPFALEDTSQPATATEIEDPLSAVMREKVLEQERMRHADYNAWKQSFLTILAELKAIIQTFNHQYADIGFQMRLQEYDVLTFEKYEDINLGKRATRTWFLGLEISGVRARERVLLFFNRASWRLNQDPKASKVSLAVSRFDGSRYQRLHIEPITLREIGYRDGELLFFSQEGIMPWREIRQTLKLFLAELIKCYL